MIADVIFIGLLLFFLLTGKRQGFVKSVLGTVSVLLCGALTVFLYGFIDKTGIILKLNELLQKFSPEDTYKTLERLGLVGYAINIIIIVALFLLIKIGYRFLVQLVDLAVPNFLNSALGAIFGGVKAIAITFAVLAVISLVSNKDTNAVLDIIEKSKIVKILYENNFLIKLIDRGI